MKGGEEKMKCCWDLYKKLLAYFSRHPLHNAFIFVMAGIGIGFLVTYPVAGRHPVRWGVAFILLAVLGNLWAGLKK